MNRNLMRHSGIFLFALFLSFTPETEGAGSKPPEQQIDAQSREVLNNLSKYLQSLQSLSIQIQYTIDIELTDKQIKHNLESIHKVAIKKPNLFELEHVSGPLGSTLCSDGQKLHTYLPVQNLYSESDAPANLSSITEQKEEMFLRQAIGGLPLLTALFHDDPSETILKDIETVQSLGNKDCEGVTCDSLLFKSPDYEWELWLAKGERPVFHKAIITKSKTLTALKSKLPGVASGETSFNSSVTFTNWEDNPELDVQNFKFTKPGNATVVPSIWEAPAPQRPRQASSHPLVGKPAPDFVLKVLGGGTFRPSTFRDQKIVVLDFWATWCGPCRMGLPILQEVAEGYKGADIVFYAVNQKEKESKVKDFVKSTKLTLPVAFDPDKKVGRMYDVDSIPRMVIIGKDGIVEVVHKGMASADQLRAELDFLLSGQSFVTSQ